MFINVIRAVNSFCGYHWYYFSHNTVMNIYVYNQWILVNHLLIWCNLMLDVTVTSCCYLWCFLEVLSTCAAISSSSLNRSLYERLFSLWLRPATRPTSPSILKYLQRKTMFHSRFDWKCLSVSWCFCLTIIITHHSFLLDLLKSHGQSQSFRWDWSVLWF